MQGLRRQTLLRTFRDDRSGNTLILSALALPVLLGVAALVVEYGNGLVTKVQNQRVSDLASYSGAIAFAETNSQPSMVAAAKRTAGLNGVEAANVSVTLVDSPKTSGAKAVQVEILTQQPLLLAKFVSPRGSFGVRTNSLAEVGTTETHVPGCIHALASSGGITLTGGTKIVAPSCTVSSNATVSVPCGTSIKTLTLNYNSAAAPSQPCGGIVNASNQPAPIVKTATTDPLAGNAAIATATQRIATVAAQTIPAGPNTGQNKNIDFGWNVGPTQNQASQIGCSASFSGNTWTLTCTGSTVNLNNMTVGGGINVNFNLSGSASVTYNFKGYISNTGAVVRFPAGKYNIANGIITGGGTTTEFGAGTFRIGRSNQSCSGANYSICNTSMLTFAGPSTYELEGGIFNSQVLTMGGGTTNSYQIGPSSGGYAFETGGGSTTTLADATGSGKLFRVKGHIRSGGGSCLKLPATAQQDIAGNMDIAGGLTLGAGIWTIDGFFALGANSGGSVWCDGESVSLKANSVSLVISGKATPPWGSCAGQAFCLSAGYSNVRLTSPTSGTMANLGIIGPVVSNNTRGARFDAGGSGGQISGTFYFPYGPITMDGGASLGGVSGGCLQLIGASISMSGGTAAGSECIAGAGGGPSSSNVSLVR